MHKHPRYSKRKILALRFFVYGIMTVATLLISIICILLVLGYQFNFSKRTLEQGGLVQLRSYPNSATVGFDGAKLSAVTPTKVNAAAGVHSVTMSLEGYRPWAKTVNLKPGQLLWLNYTRFVPESLSTDSVREFPRLQAMLPAPDRERLLLLPSSSDPTLVLADTRSVDRLQFSSLTLPATAYRVGANEAKPRFALHEWDFGSRYVLVRMTVGDEVQYLRVDTTDISRTVNISKSLGLKIDNIHFAGTNGERYYALVDGVLRSVDLGSKTISAPLATNLTSFELYGDGVLAYVAKDAAKKQSVVGLYVDGKVHEVVRFPATTAPAVTVTEYYGKTYVAVAHGKTAYIYVNPHRNAEVQAAREITFKKGPIAWIDYSSNGRFLVAGSGDDFMTYDAELRSAHYGTLQGARTDNRPFIWLDDYHFVTTGSAELSMVEFDGANREFITRAAPGFAATLSADGKALYSVLKKSDGSYVLQRSQMVVD